MRYLLFTTITCPKCPAMKSFVAEHVRCAGEILDNTAPNFGALIAQTGVQNAPTIIFYAGEKELFRTSEVGELAEWLEGIKQ